jgi:hypothetical protein
MQAFVPAATAGAVIFLLAPDPFGRALGLTVLAASALGFLLHAWLLRHDHPAVLAAWRHALRSHTARIRARWPAELGPLRSVRPAAISTEA